MPSPYNDDDIAWASFANNNCTHLMYGRCYQCVLQDPEFIKAVESDDAEGHETCWQKRLNKQEAA